MAEATTRTATSTAAPAAPVNKDEVFRRRIEGALATVRAWKENPWLLMEIAASIPPGVKDGTLFNDDAKDALLQNDELRYLQRLARYFQSEVMTWVNSGPPCSNPECVLNLALRVQDDDDDEDKDEQITQSSSCCAVRGPQSPDEVEGRASRVEEHRCGHCQGLTMTFPRFNNPRHIFRDRRGRCGEYANLFGLYVHSSALMMDANSDNNDNNNANGKISNVRYVLDWSDHVWTEVYVEHNADNNNTNNDNGGSWIMVDSCEGVIGHPGMYESGWGKVNILSYVVAVSETHVQDVTHRYTRQAPADEDVVTDITSTTSTSADANNSDNTRDNTLEARRRKITTSEKAGQDVIDSINAQLQEQLSPMECVQLSDRLESEREYLTWCQQQTMWDEEYRQGRVSGDRDWKVARGEDGTKR